MIRLWNPKNEKNYSLVRCRHFICLGLLGFLPVFEIATTDDSTSLELGAATHAAPWCTRYSVKPYDVQEHPFNIEVATGEETPSSSAHIVRRLDR